MSMSEADTCRMHVTPALHEAGWTDDQIREQVTFTAGRIIPAGSRAFRGQKKRADYLLRFRRDVPLAVVEAKAEDKPAQDGYQQAVDYAKVLGLNFAYATNGGEIIEHDFITGRDSKLDCFPSPEELWTRQRQALGLADEATAEKYIEPFNLVARRIPRYYQEIAINRAVAAILRGKKRSLLTLATGTGKTLVAFQIVWKLWNAGWNTKGDPRKPRILYLADRAILVDDPKDKDFSPFGDARHRIGDGGRNEPILSREVYFATYQVIARDDARPGLYKEFPPDFFDLVIVDECHRGSARDDSNWREILRYFSGACQLGMTATPLRKDNRDTYRYFGNPLYTYSLRQGIEDGFLAPYRVHRVVSSADATGWRPTKGQKDRYGREVPDELYLTKDFERKLVHEARTKAIACHLTRFLKKTDRFAKTVIFCVDQEHAANMRSALNNENLDIIREEPDYVARVVSDEGDVGKGFLSRFRELETKVPTILTTSKLLTTGVDMQTVKNIVLCRVVGSMTEFKQIIGRGTRVREDYGKLWFNIIDYTGSATQHFADPEFDGEPALITEEEMDGAGETVPGTETVVKEEEKPEEEQARPPEIVVVLPPDIFGEKSTGPRKYYVDGGEVIIAADLAYELDAQGKQLRCVKLTDYTGKQVRELMSSADALRSKWTDQEQRDAVLASLEERGVDLDHLRSEKAEWAEFDDLDLLCHLAFDAPLRTRHERAERLRTDKVDLFDKYGPEARAVLNELLDKYEEHGIQQLKMPDALKVPPTSEHGNFMEIAALFGGPEKLREAFVELQRLIYVA